MSDGSATESDYSFVEDEQPSIFGNKGILRDERLESSGPKTSDDIAQTAPRSTTFPFMALPNELRTQILKYALVGSGTIYSVEVVQGTSSAESQAAPQLSQDGSIDDIELNTSIGYFDYIKQEPVDDIVSTQITWGLLCLHPTLTKEARNILYGSNRFIFRGFRVLGRFLYQIGDNRALLRSIEILDSSEDLQGAMIQYASGLLLDAALNLERFHLSIDLAGPFVWAGTDHTEFLDQKQERLKKMAVYVLPCLVRMFRTRHHLKKESIDTFLDDFLGLHPVSFDPSGELPLHPFLSWNEESDFSMWQPTLQY